jgi:hypothetical protein
MYLNQGSYTLEHTKFQTFQGQNFIKFKTILGVFHSVGIPKVESNMKHKLLSYDIHHMDVGIVWRTWNRKQ